ncbi:unnamed protein product [Protopolystoma xenopodis]|uniref:Uncharacterized protein n=1 Tax=Protopolystoma xenopodis TaxID=117903 RepID=A0A448X0U4_9PLAT|nr:unnamed protein product [Protopolystoma xenopodis]
MPILAWFFQALRFFDDPVKPVRLSLGLKPSFGSATDRSHFHHVICIARQTDPVCKWPVYSSSQVDQSRRRTSVCTSKRSPELPCRQGGLRLGSVLKSLFI